MRLALILFGLMTMSTIAMGQKHVDRLGDTLVFKGKIVAEEFVNKGGRAQGYSELYFETKGERFFIKFCESHVSSAEVEKLVDHKVTAKLIIYDGLWDICEGDPEMQSRMGKYIALLWMEPSSKKKEKDWEQRE